MQRSSEYGGKLYWTHEHTRETTWRQPLPRTRSLPEDVQVRVRVLRVRVRVRLG